MRRADQRRAAVVALYQHEVTGRPLHDVMPRDALGFTRELVDGVLQHQDELDTLIERHAKNWSLDRIAPLERSILRMALFEMLYRPDVPDEVAIDEAIEAAKELCGAEAPGFINGILGAVKRTEVTP
jgi:N utilization substance protein B